MHPSIHHHQENIFGPNDESIDIIIQGAIDNDATDNPVFIDEEGKMLEAPLFLEEELKNGIDYDPNKHCLDWSLENGHVILWWCNGGRNQMWTYRDDYLGDEMGFSNLYNVDADMCLDLAGGNRYNRAPVNLYRCSRSGDPQDWIVPCPRIDEDKHDCTGRIKYRWSKKFWCLDANTPIKLSNQVILFECEETSQAQHWTMKWTGVYDDTSGHFIFYLVMDPSSKKLKGLSPPEKPS